MKWKLSPRLVLFQVFSVTVVLGTVLCLFPPYAPAFLWWEAQASTFMLLLLGLGLLFFMIDRPRFMMVAFSCCALICFVIHDRTETTLIHPELTKRGMDFSAAHVQVPERQEEIDVLLDRIRDYRPDLLSLQRIPVDGERALHLRLLREGYAHFQRVSGPGQEALWTVYSRWPLDLARPINQSVTGLVSGRVQLPGNLAYTHLQITTALPGFRLLSDVVLNRMAQQVRSPYVPALALGDFACVPWSLGLSQFKHLTRMQDSRRIVEAATEGEYMGLFQKPTFHILHSPHLQCIDFDIIRDEDFDLLGIMGTYRLTEEGTPHVSQTN